MTQNLNNNIIQSIFRLLHTPLNRAWTLPSLLFLAHQP